MPIDGREIYVRYMFAIDHRYLALGTLASGGL